MKKLLLTGLVLASAALSASATDMYVIGANVDGYYWAEGTNKMTDNGDGTYTWKGKELGSGFKFNDGSWNGSYNLGSSGPVLTLGTPYTVSNSGSSGNITFSDPSLVVNNPTVTLDLNALTVVVTGDEVMGEKQFTLAGNFNDWNGGDSNYQLKESNGLYTGTFTMTPEAQFQVVLNNQTWYGFKNENEAGITINASNPTVTVETSTGNENNFYFTTGFESSDVTFVFDFATMHLTVSLDAQVEAPTGPDLYMIGSNVNDESWSDMTNKMTNKGNGIYTWTGYVLGSGFKINDGTWDNTDYNIGAPEGSVMTVGQAFTVITGNDSKDITFANNVGSIENPTVTLDYNAKTVTVTGTPVELIPESGFFIIGEVVGCGWDPTKGLQLTKVSDGVFEGKNIELTGSYFAFTEELGNWSIVNAHRYAPQEKDTPIQIGMPNPMYYGVDASWSIDPGIYNFLVDTNNLTVTVTLPNESDSVDTIGADNGEKVIYNLQGVRVNNPVKGGIYIINGKKTVIR